MKGFADLSLLESFDLGRLPVIAQTLVATAQLYTHMISRLKPNEYAKVLVDTEDETKPS